MEGEREGLVGDKRERKRERNRKARVEWIIEGMSLVFKIPYNGKTSWLKLLSSLTRGRHSFINVF